MGWENWATIGFQLVALIFVSGGVVAVVRQKVVDIGVNLENLKKDIGSDMAEIKDTMGDRMGKIEDNLDKLTTVMVAQARHEERMNSFDQRMLAQSSRFDDFVRQQGDTGDRLARMVENTITRVNELADRGFKRAS